MLCSRREDIEAFDAAFVEAFAGRGEYPEQPDVLDDIADLVLPSVAVPPQQRVAPPGTIEESELMPAAWSDTELLREKDFAEFTAADRRMARGVMARLAARGPRRISRRTRALAPHGTASAGRARRPARHGARLAAVRRRAGRAPLA